MGYHNILIKDPRKLSTKNNQLYIDGKNIYPLEDINTIIIENRQCVITSYLLSEMTANKINVLVCDDKHLPCGCLLPIDGNTRKTAYLFSQIELSNIKKKQMWQQIVTQKIKNQAYCLKKQGLVGGYNELINLTKNVKSNDNTNIESEAARKYFTYLFGIKFKRRDENLVNACLNYAYAVIRAIIARTVVAYGFEPALGIWHHNTYNAFNLVDDLIEPYRAIIDNEVLNILQENDFTYLDTELKHSLINIQYVVVKFDQKQYELVDTIKEVVVSYQKCCVKKEGKLKLPLVYE